MTLIVMLNVVMPSVVMLSVVVLSVVILNVVAPLKWLGKNESERHVFLCIFVWWKFVKPIDI
jgi:hypothetical protein